MKSIVNNAFRQEILIDFIETRAASTYLIFSNSARGSADTSDSSSATLESVENADPLITVDCAISLSAELYPALLKSNYSGAFPGAGLVEVTVNNKEYIVYNGDLNAIDDTELWRNIYFIVTTPGGFTSLDYNTVSVVSNVAGLTGTTVYTGAGLAGLDLTNALLIMQTRPSTTQLTENQEFPGLISF